MWKVGNKKWEAGSGKLEVASEKYSVKTIHKEVRSKK